MKVIFLDIDGVLVNRRSLKQRSGLRSVADPLCVAALNHLISKTGASIVISSSWRFCGLEEMKLILNHWGVVGSVVGMTPDLTRKEPTGLYVGTPRGQEIKAYLDAVASGTKETWFDPGDFIEGFVILDDDQDMEDLVTYLVCTEFEAGLTLKDAEIAIDILARWDLAKP